MAVVTPLNNPGGPEGDTVTVAEKLLNTEYWPPTTSGDLQPIFSCVGTWYLVVAYRGNGVIHRGIYQLQGDDNAHVRRHC